MTDCERQKRGITRRYFSRRYLFFDSAHLYVVPVELI